MKNCTTTVRGIVTKMTGSKATLAMNTACSSSSSRLGRRVIARAVSPQKEKKLPSTVSVDRLADATLAMTPPEGRRVGPRSANDDW